MSKCVAVLDGEKITKIQVKQKDAPEPKSSNEPKQAPVATSQQPK